MYCALCNFCKPSPAFRDQLIYGYKTPHPKLSSLFVPASCLVFWRKYGHEEHDGPQRAQRIGGFASNIFSEITTMRCALCNFYKPFRAFRDQLLYGYKTPHLKSSSLFRPASCLGFGESMVTKNITDHNGHKGSALLLVLFVVK